MLIACLVLIGVLAIFVLATFFMTLKKYSFELEGGTLQVKNIGSHLKIYFNDNLIKDVFSPHLFDGENVDFSIGEKEYLLTCKSNTIGNKMSVKVFEGEKEICSNGVEIKEKKK